MLKPLVRTVGALVFVSSIGVPSPLAAEERSATSASQEVRDALQAISVKSKLIEKLGVDALSISVSVSGDTATLTGHVEKKATQELAEEVARSVEGIRSVDDKLEEKVHSSALKAAGSEVKDALLESKVKNVLISEIGANALKIEVEATDGVVSLRGRVNSAETARVAIRKAHSIKGVKRVVDLLAS